MANKEENNGSSGSNNNHIGNILAVDKQKAKEVLKRAEERIKEFEMRLINAYTPTERDVLKEKIDLLKSNYNVLKEKFEKNHGDFNNHKKTNKVDSTTRIPEDPIGDLEDISNGSNAAVTEEMIDNDTRKVGSYGRSYDSGFKGYTKKEAAAIKKLLPDVHKPVIIKDRDFKSFVNSKGRKNKSSS